MLFRNLSGFCPRDFVLCVLFRERACSTLTVTVPRNRNTPTTASNVTTTETSMETATESTSSITGDTTSTNVTTTATSTATTPVTTTDVPPIDYNLVDVNDDGKVDEKDASMVLVEYAKMSTGGEGDFTEKQKLAANANFDRKIDAKDASFVLAYYAMASTASGDVPTMREYMNKT